MDDPLTPANIWGAGAGRVAAPAKRGAVATARHDASSAAARARRFMGVWPAITPSSCPL